jgi:hypothetical protein
VSTRAATSDISLGGCYVEMMFTLEKGVRLEMIFHIGEPILVLGTVVTCDPHVGNGIEFSKMLPEDEARVTTLFGSRRASRDRARPLPRTAWRLSGGLLAVKSLHIPTLLA